MTYSCALFEEGTETLEEAQTAKLDLVCRKLELKPGQRLLDIGCGWGSLAIHAAREYGVTVLGITLSEAQVELARASGLRLRASRIGSSSRCSTTASWARTGFDAVASIGMVEHVGASQIDAYAAPGGSRLRTGGRALNHGIAHVAAQPDGAHVGGPFSDRYVFPDAEVLNLSRMQLAFERAGPGVAPHREPPPRLRRDAPPLGQPARREPRGSRAARGRERLRVWRLYLRAARNSFETGQNAVYQMLCSRPLTAAPSPTPTGARHEPARRRLPLIGA